MSQKNFKNSIWDRLSLEICKPSVFNDLREILISRGSCAMVTNDSQFGVAWHNRDLLLAHVIMSKGFFLLLQLRDLCFHLAAAIWTPFFFFYCFADIDHWRLFQVNLTPSGLEVTIIPGTWLQPQHRDARKCWWAHGYLIRTNDLFQKTLMPKVI